ncbi:TGF-beta-like protein [Mudlarkpox virus]|nr:TGF-beta-like protein [Mudlarkpox virus]
MIHRIFLSLLVMAALIECNNLVTIMSSIEHKNFNISLLERPVIEGKSSNIIIGEYSSPSDIVFNLSNHEHLESDSLCIYIYIKEDTVTRYVILYIDDNYSRVERNISSVGQWYCFEVNGIRNHEATLNAGLRTSVLFSRAVSNVTVRIDTNAEIDTNYPPFIEYYTSINNRKIRSYETCTTKQKYLDLKYLDMDDTIIAPRGITFKYCSGYCDINSMKNFYSNSLYGILAMKFISLKAINSNFKRCCYPESMENISILYIDPNGNIKKGELVNSTISKCVCK